MNLSTLKQIRETLSGAYLLTHAWGPARAVTLLERETAATAIGIHRTRRFTGARKDVIDTRHPAWRAVQDVRADVKLWWPFVTFPYSVPGQRLFLIARREELWSAVRNFNDQLQRAGHALDLVRGDLLAEAREALGTAYDEAAYPLSWEQAFSVEIREVSIDPPSYLAHTNAEEYSRELAARLQDIDSSMRQFETQCFARMADSLSRLSSNMEDGHRVMSGNVEALQRLFGQVSQMQFEGSAIWRQARNEAQDILDGVSIEELRQSRGVRQETKERLQGLLARYQQLQQVVLAKHAELVPA